MLDVVQGRDTSVRGIISKGRFVQGAQNPRIFGRGHIGRGHINPASFKDYAKSMQTLVSLLTNRKLFVDTKLFKNYLYPSVPVIKKFHA
jgi:hypothetical protein